MIQAGSLQLNMEMRKKVTEDISTQTRFSKAESACAPDGWGDIPEIAGCDYHTNAKIVQRIIDTPNLKNKILGHIAVNEMADQTEDGTNFQGYVNDN
jgi:hypothetical protein